ncbi:helix-turn-helix domain-containing protein [Streptomyces sp. NPDC051020]|uniref:helix-turn-helix domain-containing protein n=1 Tax=Streptomyces sp. NPDC051020 TaxID=3155409 RepID=UPI003436163A
MQAAELFEQGIKPLEVARRLRVSGKSAYQWQQLWREGGAPALASRGPSVPARRPVPHSGLPVRRAPSRRRGRRPGRGRAGRAW